MLAQDPGERQDFLRASALIVLTAGIISQEHQSDRPPARIRVSEGERPLLACRLARAGHRDLVDRKSLWWLIARPSTPKGAPRWIGVNR